MPRKRAKPKPDPLNHHITLRGRVWWCVRIVDGRKYPTSLRTDDVRTAREERDKIFAAAADARAGRVPPAPPVVRLWEDAVEGWLRRSASIVRNPSQLNSLRRYKLSITQLSEALEGTPLTEITAEKVTDFVEARRADGKRAQTVRNDLVAWSHVLKYARGKGWISSNPALEIDRAEWIGYDDETIRPPEDVSVAALMDEIRGWSEDMAKLIFWLRETGMRTGEALALRREDIHPGDTLATIRLGVKHNKNGSRIRTICLGRAATLLRDMPESGRLFAGLSVDSSVVATRYGQWHRQRQARENRVALAEGRDPITLLRFRLHDLRHAFAISSIIDDKTCIYRLQKHLGHTTIGVTEGYLRFLDGEGAQRVYGRRVDLFGSLPATDPLPMIRAA